jgi:hypothetical protein
MGANQITIRFYQFNELDGLYSGMCRRQSLYRQESVSHCIVHIFDELILSYAPCNA